MVSLTVPVSSNITSVREPGAGGPGRSIVPTTLLFNPHRDFTALEIRVWSLLDSDSVQEVQAIAQRLGVHRVSVSRALTNLTAHGFASRKNVQYRNPRTGTYEVLVYSALDGSRAREALDSENHHPGNPDGYSGSQKGGGR